MSGRLRCRAGHAPLSVSDVAWSLAWPPCELPSDGHLQMAEPGSEHSGAEQTVRQAETAAIAAQLWAFSAGRAGVTPLRYWVIKALMLWSRTPRSSAETHSSTVRQPLSVRRRSLVPGLLVWISATTTPARQQHREGTRSWTSAEAEQAHAPVMACTPMLSGWMAVSWCVQTSSAGVRVRWPSALRMFGTHSLAAIVSRLISIRAQPLLPMGAGHQILEPDFK